MRDRSRDDFFLEQIISVDFRRKLDEVAIILQKFLDLDNVKNVKVIFSSTENCKTLCIQGILQGKYGQKYSVSFSLVSPFILIMNFSVASCLHEIQRDALVFARNHFKKQITINGITNLNHGLEDFKKHFLLVDEFFNELNKFFVLNIRNRTEIKKRELAFLVPDSLRTYPNTHYSKSDNQPKSFFNHKCLHYS